MRSRICIAILECDEPAGPETRSKYGGFGNMFKELLEAGITQVAEVDSINRPELILTKHDVVHAMAYPDPDDVDAVLLTGSRYNSFDEGSLGWITRLVGFTRRILHSPSGIRVIGVCFGHQIIARALGVMPQRNNNGWEVAVSNVDLTDAGKDVFRLDNLGLHQMHRDSVPYTPPGTVSLGRSPHSEVQGMYAKGRLLSLQGHPEYSGRVAEELLDLRRGQVLDEETYSDAKKRAYDKHDGVAVGAAIVRFLLDDWMSKRGV